MDYTILQKPPLVPRLGLLHPSPKVGITPSFPSALNLRETRKITCYLTKPTHISPVLYAVHMVTRSTNRSLGSLAGITTAKTIFQILETRFSVPNSKFLNISKRQVRNHVIGANHGKEEIITN